MDDDLGTYTVLWMEWGERVEIREEFDRVRDAWLQGRPGKILATGICGERLGIDLDAVSAIGLSSPETRRQLRELEAVEREIDASLDPEEGWKRGEL